jgi:putative DNA primase/helicase
VHLIPFNCQFDPGAEPKLPDKFRTEAQGILAWAVRGCLEWQAHRLVAPASVEEATETYREKSDPLRQFIANNCVIHPDAQLEAGVLWDCYLDWAKENRVRSPLSRHTFSEQLQRMGLKKERIGHERIWAWIGICRTQDAEAQHLPPAADVRADADEDLQ